MEEFEKLVIPRVFDAVIKYDVNNPELTEFIRFVVSILYNEEGSL